MKVIKVDGIYKASRITGPKHNFLGLAIARTEPLCVQYLQKHRQNDGAPQIDERSLLAAISRGILLANDELGRSFFITCIEYVPTDTPDYTVYTDLANAIVRWAANDFI